MANNGYILHSVLYSVAAMNDMHRKGTTAPGTWTRMISFLTFMLGMGVAQFLQAHQYSALMNLYNELGSGRPVERPRRV